MKTGECASTVTETFNIEANTKFNESPNAKQLTSRKGMVIASLNINSLLSHHDEIVSLIKEQGIHFLALNETKIDENCSSEVLQIEGYNFESLDRNRAGGGVAFYIRDTFKCIVRKDALHHRWI